MPTLLSEEPSKGTNSNTPTKACNKATIAKTFDKQSPSVKQRIQQWHEQGGGVKKAPEEHVESTIQDVNKIGPSSEEVSSDRTSDFPKPLQNKYEDGDEERTTANRIDKTSLPCSEASNDGSPKHVSAKPNGAGTKKRQSSATKLRIAQAIVGPTVRPSERLRRLSEARKGVQQAAATIEVKKGTEIKAEAAKGKLKTKELATPKKRIISDTRWKAPKSASAASNQIPTTAIASKPAVQVWLTSIPSEAPEVLRDKPVVSSLITDISSNNSTEQGHEECRQITKRGSSTDQIFEKDISDTTRQDCNSKTLTSKRKVDITNEILRGKAALSSEQPSSYSSTLDTSSVTCPRPAFAPTSSLPTSDVTGISSYLSSKVPMPSPSAPRSVISFSSSNESDNLTSISRRPPKKPPDLKKKNIFTHAVKLLSKADDRLEVGKIAVQEPSRTPNIESWLHHTNDPFIEENGLKITSRTNDCDGVNKRSLLLQTAPMHSNKGYMGDTSLSVQQQRESSPNQPVHLSRDALNKRKRLRRVIRHRDGTVTAEDETVLDDCESSGSQEEMTSRRNNTNTPKNFLARTLQDLPNHAGQSKISTKIRQAELAGDGHGDLGFEERKRGSLYDFTQEGFSADTISEPTRSTRKEPRKSSQNASSLYHKPAIRISNRKQQDPGTKSKGSERAKRLAKHSDLISVLSTPKNEGSSIQSARSVRTHRSKLSSATIADILNEFANDEQKYKRELSTLVDGVIPVLLSSVLSHTEVTSGDGFLNPSSTSDDKSALSKSIFDMGLALEKLKAKHEKTEFKSADDLTNWAEEVSTCYINYLVSWRMGFQDVVINLANLNDHESEQQISNRRGKSQEPIGVITNAKGERVDVAFFLKRPLVRLKNIAKSLKGVVQLEPTDKAQEQATHFKLLVDEARRRSNEERARLEDEAAATIDSTKARDPRTLAPISDPLIRQQRRVKARDSFDLRLLHSSGQRLDCKVELFLREDPPESGSGSDFMISEMDGTGRWLLFPPLNVSDVSAKTGNRAGEIIVMIRGMNNEGLPWYEVLSLTTDDDRLGSEWVQMLGIEPIPFDSKALYYTDDKLIKEPRLEGNFHDDQSLSSASMISSVVQVDQIHIPIGERPPRMAKRWHDNETFRSMKMLSRNNPSTIIEETLSALAEENKSSLSDFPAQSLQLSPQDRSGSTDSSKPKSERAQKIYISDTNSHSPEANGLAEYSVRQEAVYSPSESLGGLSSHIILQSLNSKDANTIETDTTTRRTENTPKINSRGTGPARYHFKPNPKSQPDHFQQNVTDRATHEPRSDNILHQHPFKASGIHKANESTIDKPSRDSQICESRRADNATAIIQSSATPPQKTCRASSPLKREYAPSSTSNSGEESDASTVVHDVSSMSDSSDSELDEDERQSVFVPMSAVRRYRKAPRTTNSDSIAEDTLSPSQSASQAPYREVPFQPGKSSRAVANISHWSDKGAWEGIWPTECVIIVSPGLIEAFELHNNAARIESNLGHLAHSRLSSRPLLGLELTPLVPIRRGTALDISIRSPPTTDSRFTSNANNNFLFRSAGPEECELLYALINHARINNPTYIALQNARAVSFNPQFQEIEQRDGPRSSKSSSWFGLGRKTSYRASSAPTSSVSRNTESSVGSIGSAFSAFRNFGRSSGRFNLARSTITSRQGGRNLSLRTTGEELNNSSALVPVISGEQHFDGALGLNNCRIRLYIRENTSKWSDLGSARLTIMRPSNILSAAIAGTTDQERMESTMPMTYAGTGASTGHGIGMASAGGYTSPGNKISANDKRILITASSKSIVLANSQPKILLDVTLGETCFERVARTGIAISVWENFEGGLVAKQGGVIGGRLRVYMMQFKNEADTAFTYSIVGKLRY